ncbi:helix-turn-helix domain-containing protein [Bradyrhizobium sp. cf659]|uniref:helix-turn-helix domain-containing protein n=1 Tax=Bradyrhizobium sp. cf659 TaxID=1761771 RepID=UPI0008E540B5|nr:Helix-turn-helix domain-containing protein [Bradyrhizobium sp. cf659]
MSWQATAWAAKQRAGSPGAKLLLLALANYADDTGHSWPSQETLATDTEQSVDTVQRQLRKLEAAKLIEKAVRPQGRGRWPGRTYRLNMPVAEKSKPQSAAWSEQENPSIPPEGFGPHHAAPDPSTVPHSYAVSPCRTAMRHEQTIEPSKEPPAQHQHLRGAARESPKGRPSVAERQAGFQRKRGNVETVQNRIAQRLGADGWVILQAIGERDLDRLTKLQERGRLSDSAIERLRLAFRAMSAA